MSWTQAMNNPQDVWTNALRQCPELHDVLLLLYRRSRAKGMLPASATLTSWPLRQTVVSALEQLGCTCRKTRDNRLRIKTGDVIRTPDVFQALARALNIHPVNSSTSPEQPSYEKTLQTIALSHPELSDIITAARAVLSIRQRWDKQLITRCQLDGLLRLIHHVQQDHAGVTLSSLGAQFLNDSKALRAGMLRQMLDDLLRAVSEPADVGEDIEPRFGIIDNPVTQCASVYGPLRYIRASQAFDWIDTLYRNHQVAHLGWDIITTIDRMETTQPVAEKIVITSENAAPFYELIQSHIRHPVLYTAGFPNAAVLRLLSLLADAGFHCRHWGDSDFAGYLIADCVARRIPTTLWQCGIDDLSVCPSHHFRPLAPAEHLRAQTFLASRPDFRYAAEIRFALEKGWLEQEKKPLVLEKEAKL